MNVPFFVAGRYLWSKKSHRLIQLISWSSLASFLVCSAALFIVLSVFNGLQSFIGNHLNSFHADVEITAVQGKTFMVTPERLADLRGIKGVEYLSEVCCDLAVLTFDDRQFIARLKGVAPDYSRLKRMDTTVFTGIFALESEGFPLAVLSAGVMQKLHCGISDYVSNSLGVCYPDRTRRFATANPMQGLNMESLTPVGCFVSGTSYDADYVFTVLSFVQRLTGHEGEVTSVELRVAPGMSVRKVADEVEKMMGPAYRVRDLYQQEEELYKVMRSEKWAIFAILSFILLIASFNMIGMMAVLVLDKKRDMGVFYAIGADTSFIRRVFVREGVLIATIGTMAGLAIGFIFCWLQKSFHLIRFGDGGYAINYYPVEIHGTDIAAIFAIVCCITLPAMAVPVMRISDSLFKNIRHE
ncbi:MAG: FtsX-like permease family protein [Bacteroidales bacterium]|nr:FtsX-like permease family protein [Bacteroidales bacterium]